MKSRQPIYAVVVLFLGLPAANGQCTGPTGPQALGSVTGSPFSADLVNEFTHEGQNGVRTQWETHGKVYRDAQGRGRCDVENVKMKVISFANISDPVSRLFIHLDLEKRTAIVTHHSQRQPASPQPSAETRPATVNAKRSNASHSEEDLGAQVIQGFTVEGRRYINTTETGQRSVTDDWYSPDLKVTLLSTQKYERSNTLANKVVNIQVGDPDPAVFQVPEGYTVKDRYCHGSRCDYDSP
jgi:hypothetical protein